MLESLRLQAQVYNSGMSSEVEAMFGRVGQSLVVSEEEEGRRVRIPT